jgi:hypothetical protein
MMKSDQVHRPEIEVALASVQAQYQEIIGGGSFDAFRGFLPRGLYDACSLGYRSFCNSLA